MSLSFLLVNSAVLFTLIDITATAVTKCEKIDTSLLPNCAKIGYNFTANFSYVGLQSYQAYVASEVALFSDRFNSCSRHSKPLVCARYVPKCSEDVKEAVFPCREVCEQFVDDCENALNDSGLYYQYVAYCRLLSSDRESSKQCFKPPGFLPRGNATRERRLPSCETVTKPACVNNKLSSLGNRTRTRLQSSLNSLAPVINSNCSLNLKRLACFIETSPCEGVNGRTLHACQSLCQEVRGSCEDEFKRHNIFFPKCIPNHAESSVGYGLCHMPQLPVPWPTSGSHNGHKRLQCYCNNCSNNRCTTNGSCVMQRSSEAAAEFVQTCLDKGPKRDLLCNSTQSVHCCENDFCNGKPQVGTRLPSSATPTDNTDELREQGGTKMKNDPDTSKPATDKEKNGIASGFLTLAVVGFLIVIFAVALFGHYLAKKIKNNSKARKRGNPKYVNKSNISSNGKAVTIGDSNKGFEDGNEIKTETALYY